MKTLNNGGFIGPFAAIGCKLRQAWKGAAVAADLSAKMVLVRLPPSKGLTLNLAYQVLARKWRPQTFQQFVGQKHVVQTIVNALEQQRLHHAYIFSGMRGIGKTTIARIFAKSLNCEKGISANPCGQCNSCITILQGRFIDLIEIDAASRTKVEDMRELLNNVQYAPTQGRFKVYLIDEIHMLSHHSFNALLKTLEEPPDHVKFLLATTDPQKLPMTIRSRCLQFNLTQLSIEQIIQQTEYILQQEQIQYEKSALTDIARVAQGSMRDALSMLDQAISYTNGVLTASKIREMLGIIEQETLLELLASIGENNPNVSMEIVHQIALHVIDFDIVLAELLSLLHQITVIQLTSPASKQPSKQTEISAIGADSPHGDRLYQLAQSMSEEYVQLLYQIALIGRKDLPLAVTLQSGFEMIVLRMHAFSPRSTHSHPNLHPPSATNTSAPPQKEPLVKEPLASYQVASASDHSLVQGQKKALTKENWPIILKALKLSGVAKAIVEHCSFASYDGQQVKLLLTAAQAPLLNKMQEKRIAQALCDYLGYAVILIIDIGGEMIEPVAIIAERERLLEQQKLEQKVKNDPNVKEILKRFNAKIIPDSIKIR